MTGYESLADTQSVRRLEDGAIIPCDPANTDWLDYQKWLADGNAATPYVSPPPPPVTLISDRQFFQQLAVAGKITQSEALAYVGSGALPQSMADLIALLPDSQQFAAKMLVIGANTFDRDHPLTAQLGALYGMSVGDLDAFWTAAGAL